MKPPISYFGGKRYMVKNILPLPAHDCYVEVFFGGGSIYFAKPPSRVEVINDIDDRIVNFYRVLRDDDLYEKFLRAATYTPHARSEFKECLEKSDDPVEDARRTFVRFRQGFGGMGDVYGFSITNNRAGAFSNIIKRLDEIHNRIRHTQIECKDFRYIIEHYDSENTLFYCDPPYIQDTRRDGGYENEMTNDDHIDLVKLLNNIKGNYVLSGYDHEIYKDLKYYDKKQFNSIASSAGVVGNRKGINAKIVDARTETIWIGKNMEKQYSLF